MVNPSPASGRQANVLRRDLRKVIHVAFRAIRWTALRRIRSSTHVAILRTVIASIAVAASPLKGQQSAQQPPADADRWNSPRVLDLVERGRSRRQSGETASSLRDYRARAEGYVYFLMDRTGTGERSLVKADQVALDVSWKAPGLVKQEIIGRRDEERLPTGIRYHLDHLTVVTDDFDDRITLGEGEEVRAVVHPLAPGSDELYDFRLADSLTLTFPGQPGPIRVYEVLVRPRDEEASGFVGSVYLDRSDASVVRMTFTFTPASYIDPYLDHIRISLDNGLWNGEFWLPYRQEIEIRREIPFLDLPAGSVIRAVFRIRDYRFNTGIPARFFAGPDIVTRPEEELRSYIFDEGLFAQAQEEGLAPTPSLAEIRSEALGLLVERRLSGLRSLRPAIPSASSIFRYNRAEGAYVGGALRYQWTEADALEGGAGYAFGRGRPSLALNLTRSTDGSPGTAIRAYWNRLNDHGPVAATSGAINSIAALLTENDFLDPYFSSGIEISQWLDPDGFPAIELAFALEEHSSGSYELDDAPALGGSVSPPGTGVRPTASSDLARPVLPVNEGLLQSFSADLVHDAAAFDGQATLRGGVLVGRLDDSAFLEVRGEATWHRDWLGANAALDARIQAGALAGDAPSQSLYRLGGRQTLPGYGFRASPGDWYWLARISTSWGLAGPWIRPRAFAAIGQTGFSHLTGPAGWPGEPTGHPLVSAGVGAGLLWDVLHLDVGRGLNGGDWEWMLSVRKSFWPLL